MTVKIREKHRWVAAAKVPIDDLDEFQRMVTEEGRLPPGSRFEVIDVYCARCRRSVEARDVRCVIDGRHQGGPRNVKKT